jgi:hypothetical protein
VHADHVRVSEGGRWRRASTAKKCIRMLESEGTSARATHRACDTSPWDCQVLLRSEGATTQAEHGRTRRTRWRSGKRLAPYLRCCPKRSCMSVHEPSAFLSHGLWSRSRTRLGLATSRATSRFALRTCEPFSRSRSRLCYDARSRVLATRTPPFLHHLYALLLSSYPYMSCLAGDGSDPSAHSGLGFPGATPTRPLPLSGFHVRSARSRRLHTTRHRWSRTGPVHSVVSCL